MPANDPQSRVLSAQYAMPRTRFASDPNAFVGIDMLISHTQGSLAVRLVPDLFVAFGVAVRTRGSYKVKEEGKVPDFVLEVASPSTFNNDLKHKKDTYERLGVTEYCVFDPVGGRHWPRLQLFRLVAGIYKPVSYRGDPEGPMAVTSETLGLELRFDENELRLWDLEFQAFLLEHGEEHDQRLKERDERAEERAMRVAAEQRTVQVERQMDELRRLINTVQRQVDHAERRADRADQRAEKAERQADKADQRAEKAEQRAESESQARRRAGAELANLKDQPRRDP